MRIKENKIDGFHTKLISINGLIIGIATEIGPRILFVASEREPRFNLFAVPGFEVSTPEGCRMIYGGHRLWSAPEANPGSYSLDNQPVKVELEEERAVIYGNPEMETNIQKKIEIQPYLKSGIQITHIIKNIGRRPITMACWALSVMRKGGFAVMPLKPLPVDEEGLLPDRHISLWPYTDLSDEKMVFTKDYLFVRQEPTIPSPFKIGTKINPLWVAYWVAGMAFVKQVYPQTGSYPDFGCNVEVFADAEMLELETLGVLKTIEPSKSIQHIEVWNIFQTGGLAPEPDMVRKKLEVLIKPLTGMGTR